MNEESDRGRNGWDWRRDTDRNRDWYGSDDRFRQDDRGWMSQGRWDDRRWMGGYNMGMGTGQGNMGYGMGNYPYGSYSQGYGSYGQPYGSYGQPWGSYGQSHGVYGQSYGQHMGQPYGSYNQGFGSYGQPYGSYGQPYGSYGSYGQSYNQGFGPHRFDDRTFGRWDEPYSMSHQYGSQGYMNPNLYGNQIFDRGYWDDRNRQFHTGNLNEMQSQQDRWRRQMGVGTMGTMGTSGMGYDPNLGSGSHIGKGPRGYRRPDERIREEISDALTRHPHIDATNIDVKVLDGEVTLSGTVDDRQQKREAEWIAERCEGVKDVHNQIKVQRTDIASNNLTGSTATPTGRSRSTGSSAT
jgi:osmotically-inducible protein OsmY